MTEDEIYRRIGQLLMDEAPESAVTVIVDAELSPEDDHCRLLFDYVDGEGERDWFSPSSGEVDGIVMNSLVALGKLHKAQNLTAGLPAWNACEIAMDIVGGKLKIDFRYDETLDLPTD
ncbi:hypothetical protein [Pseudomonas gozinkensis]|uniref:hypothetical protein n=1 Tax=Pseudomonas gozinkensis TaxID=2774461 RepID=UPI0017886CE8|nr:hypothetical protein [Pseudomonas gozinkensis]